MARNEVGIGTRPLEDGRIAHGNWPALRALLLGSCAALLLMAGMAAAQGPPREDPGNPPPDPGHTDEGWLVLGIPGLPAGSVLGDVWVAPNGNVYVWAKYPQRVSTGSEALEDPVEGERLPNPRGDNSKNWSSNLYRYNGTSWNVVLRTPGETGVALMGYGTTDLFASTTSQMGEARLYHLNGGNWVREELPGYYLGRLHTMLGTPNDLYFKIDRVILHHDGNRVLPVFELPGHESAERGMAAIGNGSMVVMAGDCHYLFDNGAWTCVEAGFDFGHVEDAWGMRDANGQLQLYAIGDDGDNSGLKVWKYNENDPTLHDGIWVPVVLDPMSGHVPDIGSGFHMWGNAGNDVYATGVVNGEGHMLRFNGTSWVQLLAPQPFGAIHGVWGTPQGAVWFSAEGGTMIRYLPPPAAVAAPAAAQPLAASERNGALLVRYELPAATRVHIGVYDVAGRMRGTVEDGVRAPGVHETSWNGAELVPGVYFVKLRTNGAAVTKRVVVLR